MPDPKKKPSKEDLLKQITNNLGIPKPDPKIFCTSKKQYHQVLRWLIKNKEEYHGQWVVLIGNELIDHDKDKELLLERITEIKPDDFIMVEIPHKLSEHVKTGLSYEEVYGPTILETRDDKIVIGGALYGLMKNVISGLRAETLDNNWPVQMDFWECVMAFLIADHIIRTET